MTCPKAYRAGRSFQKTMAEGKDVLTPEDIKSLTDTLKRLNETVQSITAVINQQAENTRRLTGLLNGGTNRVVQAIEDSTSAPWLPGPLMQVYSDLGAIKRELVEITSLLSRLR